MHQTVSVEAMYITDVKGIDPMEVYWRDYSLGEGSVTITCYGEAWTSWWGAMGDETIKQFFASAGTDYLCSKLHGSQYQRYTKGHEQYLMKIIDAIKAELKAESVPA